MFKKMIKINWNKELVVFFNLIKHYTCLNMLFIYDTCYTMLLVGLRLIIP
jgi:hypothetical protein